MFIQLVRRLPRESLPYLARTMQTQTEGWPAREARGAALKFFRAAGFPDAERCAADWVRAGLRVVGEQ